MAFVRLVCLRPRLGALYKFRRHTYFGRTLHYNTLGNIQDICHRATTGPPAYAHTHVHEHSHERSHALTHRQTFTHARSHARSHSRMQTDICALYKSAN